VSSLIAPKPPEFWSLRSEIDIKVLEALYDKGNNGLIKTIINIAKPLVDAFGNQKGVIMSKEILDGIEENMRTKYGQIGRGINSMLTEIMSKLNVKVDNIC